LHVGDIVFPRRGDLTKRALIGPEQEGWLCGTGCLRFRPAAGVDAAEVFEGISGDAASAWLIEHAVGTTMLNLNTQIVSALPVTEPSSEGNYLARACAGMAALVRDLGVEVERLMNVRSAMLNGLLSSNIEMAESYDLLLDEVA
jgi:type I restriction enzyme S subunit